MNRREPYFMDNPDYRLHACKCLLSYVEGLRLVVPPANLDQTLPSHRSVRPHALHSAFFFLRTTHTALIWILTAKTNIQMYLLGQLQYNSRTTRSILI